MWYYFREQTLQYTGRILCLRERAFKMADSLVADKDVKPYTERCCCCMEKSICWSVNCALMRYRHVDMVICFYYVTTGRRKEKVPKCQFFFYFFYLLLATLPQEVQVSVKKRYQTGRNKKNCLLIGSMRITIKLQ